MFLKSSAIAQAVLEKTPNDRYSIVLPTVDEEFFQVIEQQKQQLDCLILPNDKGLNAITTWLHGRAVLLPAVILDADSTNSQSPNGSGNTDDLRDLSTEAAPGIPGFIYHMAEVHLSAVESDRIEQAIEQAITRFLTLSPFCRLTSATTDTVELAADLTAQNFLVLQQRRLAEKLRERLGYLGVYYKRNPQAFFRYLSPDQKQEFLAQLKLSYRDIILRYFSDDGTVNDRIDEFVNTAFFADISVSQIVETHMELMDEFSKQLKLEGRSEEILLDYRLTLIDTIAHLCEMYRRSIPRES